MPYNEIDLSDILECQFLKTDAVAVKSSRPNLKLKIALLRIKEREKLRIGKKNVYVIALAVIDLSIIAVPPPSVQ